MRTIALAAFLLFLVAGCATVRPDKDLQVGMSMAEVEGKMGKPRETLVDSAGRTVWFYPYPRGKEIRESYAVTFGSDGRVQAIEQRLTRQNIAKVSKGMTKREVVEVLGPPWMAYELKRLPYEEWDWRVTTDLDNDLLVRFTPEGRVHEFSLLHDPKYDRVR